MNVNGFSIVKGLAPPVTDHGQRPNSQTQALVELAQAMEIGDAAVLNNSQAQQFRTVLAGMGFYCATDGWRCEVRGKTLAFKLPPFAPSSTEWSNWEI